MLSSASKARSCPYAFTKMQMIHRRLQTRKYVRDAHNTSVAAELDSHEDSSTGRVRLLPGATIATLLMLGTLHARRLYEQNKLDKKRLERRELEFEGGWKATFLQVLMFPNSSR